MEQQKIDKKSKNQKIFWFSFFGVIITGIIVYAVLISMATTNIENLPKAQKEVVIKNLITKLQKQAPQVFQILAQLDTQTKQQIDEIIQEKINKVYAPVYDNIDEFVEFHYTLKGDYSELFVALTGKIEKLIQNKLFKPANFEENLQKALNEINSDVIELVTKNYKQMEDKLQKQLNLSQNEITYLLNNILKYSVKDAIGRYQKYNYNSFRFISTSAGVGLGTTLLAKSLAKKISTKLLIKAGAKVATKTAAGAGGATIGAETGFAFGGPIGAAIGGLVGGTIAWFASDEIIIHVDKYINSKQFKKEIIKMIDEQKQNTIKVLETIYIQNLQKLHNSLSKSITELKHKTIKELIKE